MFQEFVNRTGPDVPGLTWDLKFGARRVIGIARRFPALFFVFEEWESEDALARHFQSEHMKVFQRHVPDLVAGPPAIKRYAIASAAPM